MSLDKTIEDTKGRTQGEIIVFISGKGGVGKTITSVNLAVSLASKGFSTCILDGNFQFGDVNLALDIQSAFTIRDLIQDAEAMQGLRMSYYLEKHDSGLKVLSAPLKLEEAELINQQHIKAICHKILEEQDFLIVDLPTGISENNLTFMEMAHKIFLVTQSSFAAVKNTKAMLRVIDMLNMKDKVRVIINNCDTSNIINSRNIQDILDIKKISFISNNAKLVSKSFAMGTPFVTIKPKEKISKEINALADELCNDKKLKGNLID